MCLVKLNIIKYKHCKNIKRKRKAKYLFKKLEKKILKLVI